MLLLHQFNVTMNMPFSTSYDLYNLHTELFNIEDSVDNSLVSEIHTVSQKTN